MKKKELILTLSILVALVLGVLVGEFALYDASATAQAAEEATAAYTQIGELVFFRPLKMMIIPLVFVSVVVGVTSIGDPERLGLVGGATLGYYFTTMLFAVFLGLTLVTTIGPGRGVDAASLNANAEAYEKSRTAIEAGSQTHMSDAFLSLIEQLIPENPFRAAVEGNTLGIVFVSILLGLALVMCGKAGRPAIAVFESLFQALLKLVIWIIYLAPIGVFFLVAGRIGQTGLSELAGPVGMYSLTVVVGLLLHGVIVLPVLMMLTTRKNPYRYMWAMRKPLLTAFSTASSSATLPMTIEEAQTRGGCSRRSANFVLPLGATVNMDGTALYQGVAVVFLFQVYGQVLSFDQLLVILITATLAAVGAAAIPSAGLVTMAIVITAVNSSLTSMGGEDAFTLPLSAIGIVLGVDRVLDMCRTAVNVWGDAVGAKIITRLAPDDDPAPEGWVAGAEA